MHRSIRDIDPIRNQADGESQYAAGAERRARGDVGMWTLDADLRACVSEVRTAV